MAIEWEPRRCTAKGHVAGAWRGLGSESSVPFDDDVLNNGKFEGRDRTPDEVAPSLHPDDPNFSLRDQLNGKRLADLRAALDEAKPKHDSKQHYLGHGARKPCSRG